MFENLERDKALNMDILKKCDRLFRGKPQLFTNIHSICGARIPVTHMLHAPTLLKCDVSFKNMLAVYNSRFLKFLTSLDMRILFFFFVIKQWKKERNLPISTYCLTMLSIFYLQNLPSPMLPPVSYLQEGVEKQVTASGWNCSLRDTPFEIVNKMPLREMLRGFFQFLATTDFAIDAISPLLGTTVEKWKFMDPSLLHPLLLPCVDEERGSILQYMKPVCVVDPFELNHNIAKGLTLGHIEEMASMSAQVAKNFENPMLSLLGKLF
jgi:hypothetical protein